MTEKPLAESVIKKIQMVKLLYDIGSDYFKVSENVEKIGVGIVLLQDSIELFLMAICEYLDISLGDFVPFDKYFVELHGKTGEEVPLKKQMLIINRQRVNIKHHGILPRIDDCNNFVSQAKDFFEELSTRYLNIDFDSITLVDLLNNERQNKLLKEAEIELKSGDFRNCQTNCRKAMYFLHEVNFDIKRFGKTDNYMATLLGGGISKAPHYAKNKKYIEENVKDPIDYIVIDHEKLDTDLLLHGVAPIDYWNIWRLTPPVYYDGDAGEWVVKDDFKDEVYNKENAEYCFRKTVEILLLYQRSLKQTKYVKSYGTFIKIKDRNVKILEKASINSKINRESNECDYKVFSHGKVRGLDDKKSYYEVSCEFEIDDEKVYEHGYICEDDVIS